MKLLKQNRFTNKSLLTSVTLLISILAAGLFFTSCKKELANATNKTNEELITTAAKNAKSPDIIVHSGQSIQAAVDAAGDGYLIRIEAGIYKESIVINKPGIQLIGSGSQEVIIDNPGGEENGITVRGDGDGFVLKNVTVQNFEKNGVFMIRVDNFLLSHVDTKNDGEYGLFPLFCNGGVIEHCSATGHSDTGIYVGQSENVVMEHNVAWANTNGLEIENCTNVTASKNKAYNNVCGILAVLLPTLATKTSANILIEGNHITNNNLANTADPEDGFEALVPSGSGILVVGVDQATVKNNKISGNNFIGVAIVSTANLAAIAGIPVDDIEPNADGARVIGNLLQGNGTAPPPPLIPLPSVDLLWDGTGTNNCWSDNHYSTSYPSPLPVCN